MSQTPKGDAQAARAKRYSTKPVDFAAKTLGYQGIWAVQHAIIEPPVAKLALLNIAIHANGATGIAYPGADRLAWECSCSEATVKRVLRAAKAAGLIEVVAVGGGARATRYRLNLERIALGLVVKSAKPMPGEAIAERRGVMGAPGSPVNPVQGLHSTRVTHDTAPVSPVTQESHQSPKSHLGEDGGVAPSGLPSAPSGPAPALPAQLERATFEALVNQGKATPGRVSALAAKAFELVAAGHDPNSLALLAIERGHAGFATPPKARPVGTAPARATRRRKTPVIDPGRDTRAPGRDYSAPSWSKTQ